MRMIPASPHDTGSPAEKRIFERLRTAFDDRYAAYHSLRPTRHPHKRFPEIDFVICGPEGLYAIEVKGGRIACHDGVWHYQDRYDRTTPSHEGPFRQAEAALHGLMEDLRANLPADVLGRFTTGYGVVFPDCEWSGVGAEWDPAMLAGKRRSRDLEGWLSGLFEYWRVDRGGRQARPDDGALERLQAYLRPQVDPPDSEDAWYPVVRSGGGCPAAYREADRRSVLRGPGAMRVCRPRDRASKVSHAESTSLSLRKTTSPVL